MDIPPFSHFALLFLSNGKWGEIGLKLGVLGPTGPTGGNNGKLSRLSKRERVRYSPV